MTAQQLPVRHIQQEVHNGCLAACAQMILLYLQIPTQQRQLNRIFERNDMGARFTHIDRIAQFGVKVALHQGDETHLYQAIDSGSPPIIFVATGELTSY